MVAKNFEYVYDVKKEKVVGDEGLKAYVRKVFGYMATSLGITSLITYLMLRTNLLRFFLNVSEKGITYSGLGYLALWSPLLIVLFMSFNRNITAHGSKIGLFLLSGIEGISVSLLLLGYGVHNAFQAFLLTGIIFGSMALYGYFTDTDLLKLGNILIMGLWGLVIVSIISFFTGGVGIWFSYASVIIFTGLVAYETQQIKNIYYMIGNRGETADKIAVFCALNLYLDFLNIFVSLLRIMGNNRD